MSGEEAEALRLLAQQHRGEIAVAEADLAAFGDGAGNAEGLQADADGLGRFGRDVYKRQITSSICILGILLRAA